LFNTERFPIFQNLELPTCATAPGVRSRSAPKAVAIVDRPRPRFDRIRGGAMALPDLERGGEIEELRRFLDVDRPAGWVLVESFLVAGFVAETLWYPSFRISFRPSRCQPIAVVAAERIACRSARCA
jgi:hypothetical protein